MTHVEEIAHYKNALSKALRGLPDAERDDIVAEIGAHLDHRNTQGKLNEAIAELGSPASCARAFRDELTLQTAFNDGGPARTLGALAILATRHIIAMLGLFITGLFLIMSFAMALTGIAELFTPETVGLWVEQGGAGFSFGMVGEQSDEVYREYLGGWYFPVAVLLSVVLYLLSQWIGRAFLKLMMGRSLPPSANQ